ncbi:MAG: hypothetical protein K0U70_06935 [Actinomycetia bacterium]|nr:hypothetical protein [Actinomycetes bacterium]MCH9710759.1 hypothetical protein [Actinomycetes bacterium]MCH9767513.1 hypothetical protein [Actinomycetes bacterium]
MRSFRRRESVTDADRVDEPPANSAADADQARALAEEAEAEAKEAEATAAAARAHARALRLRREAQQAADVQDSSDRIEPDTVDAEVDAREVETEAAEPGGDASTGQVDDSSPGADEAAEPPTKSPRLRLPRPTWKGIAATVVVLCTVALLAASGYMIWNHRQAEKLQARNAEYAAAARQGVVTLMSLNFTQAQEDVQRIIDTSTGQFKDDFEQQAADFVAVAQDSKVITDVTVNATAVDSMTDDTAVVLVAASSRVTNSAGADQEPRTWRLSVGLQREDGQIKMAKVEFVP